MSRELDGIRAILVCPTYGPPDPDCQKDLRVAMMTASNHGIYWAGDSSTDRMPYGTARNSAAMVLNNAPDGEIDGAMWVDSDIRMAPGDILRLINSVRVYKADFVTGIYHQRAGDYWPVLYDYNAKVKSYNQMATYPDAAFFPVDACGFGFVWTSTRLVRAIAAKPFFNDKKGMWFPDQRDTIGFGEDVSFCNYAMQCGIQLYANTTVQVGHSGEPRVYTKDDFDRKRKESKDETVGK